MKLSLIAAIDRRRAIGYQNKLLFWLPNEQDFRILAQGSVAQPQKRGALLE